MKIEWSQRALGDIEQIIQFIAQDDPVAAYELVDRIMTAVETNLPTNPNMGRAGRVHGTRELIVHANYLVAYQATDAIQILSVVHAARLRPATW